MEMGVVVLREQLLRELSVYKMSMGYQSTAHLLVVHTSYLQVHKYEYIYVSYSVRFSVPDEFFENLATEKDKFYKWVGELYLELHNGTYTTQVRKLFPKFINCISNF